MGPGQTSTSVQNNTQIKSTINEARGYLGRFTVYQYQLLKKIFEDYISEHTIPFTGFLFFFRL